MKRVKALMVGAMGVVAMASGPSALAGIDITKHNLSSSGTGNHTTATAEICVFCHTPHGSDTSAPVPLWNRKMSSSGSYTTYDALGTSTLDGKIVPVGSVSLACLSCHDGSQSMDSVINAPGSGGYNAAGARMTGGTWSGSTVNATGVLQAGITMLGTDLRNDHPVGVQYGGGGATAATCGSGCGNDTNGGFFNDPDFKSIQHMSNNGKNYWWVEKDGNAGRSRLDIILYTRTEATGANVEEPFVECASCHDPHVSSTPTFLRISNAGSGLCLACHIK